MLPIVSSFNEQVYISTLQCNLHNHFTFELVLQSASHDGDRVKRSKAESSLATQRQKR